MCNILKGSIFNIFQQKIPENYQFYILLEWTGGLISD